jgi:ribonuclease HII
MQKYYKTSNEIGVDEAGAGALAGPVFAAAVIWGSDNDGNESLYSIIKDSKKLSEKQREKARIIIEKNAYSYSIASLDEEYIDKNNILNSRIDCMHLAIREMQEKNSFQSIDTIIVDGDKFKDYYQQDKQIEHKCIVKGDNKYMSIAAASILAKTERDRYMKSIDVEHPEYNWKKNKGYGTKEHYLKLKEHGQTKYHRKTYRLY